MDLASIQSSDSTERFERQPAGGEREPIRPAREFAAIANVRDASIYERAGRDPAAFWAEQASRLTWRRAWDRVLDWDAPWAQWFSGGQLNACENCVDRHLATWRRNKAAIIWEGEPGEQRVLTYRDLHREVARVAAVLRGLGVRAGDRVAIYMPVIPELPIAMLACARLGAVHAVVFSGYSSEALTDRINDCGARVLVTADGGYHRGNVVPLKDHADLALLECPTVEHVLVARRIGEPLSPVVMHAGRDHWWHEMVDEAPWDAVSPEPVESEHPLAIMYASGAAGRPKGLLHTTGGYLVGTVTTASWIFDLKDEDVFFSTGDLGWSIGQSYSVYGPLANGATVLLYEGTADIPTRDRYWRMIARHGVTVLSTSPSAIRTAMRADPEPGRHHDLSSLRLLSAVGEPIGAETWMWYYEHVGGGRCPIVDNWWQTETGMAMIAPLPGITPLKPGSATLPLPGVQADIMDDQGFPVGTDMPGHLVITAPWPAMARTIWHDPERYYRTHWGRFEGVYLTGDGARRDADGYYWLLGRVDDVLNVAGQRISTLEIENELKQHPSVADTAVVGVRHPMKGQAIAAYVVLGPGQPASDAMTVELKAFLVEKIGDLARPDHIYYLDELPRGRGSQVMRRLLRDVAEGTVPGGTAALLDPNVRAHYTEPVG
ncbi:MAG TPA: acetate--CoA ligase [Ktedonobacterales bacterium]